MRGDLKIRKEQIASGATAVQVAQNKGTRRYLLKHIGIAHEEHEFSESRYKKDKQEFDKQVKRALALLKKTSPVGGQSLSRKPPTPTSPFSSMPIFRQRQRSCWASKDMSPTSLRRSCRVVQLSHAYYHDLWNVAQAFRMSKSDRRHTSLFHRSEDAIRAYLRDCFMALMMGKNLEIKMHRS